MGGRRRQPPAARAPPPPGAGPAVRPRAATTRYRPSRTPRRRLPPPPGASEWSRHDRGRPSPLSVTTGYVSYPGAPPVPRVEQVERTGEPPPGRRVQPRESPVEVGFVLVTPRLGLVEQDDLRAQVRNAVGRPGDRLAVGPAQPSVPVADPGIAVARVQEDVGTPAAGGRIEHPDLPVPRVRRAVRRQPVHRTISSGIQLQAGEVATEPVEAGTRDGELDVLVLAGLLAVPEVQRPATGDVPGQMVGGKPGGELRRPPWLPCVEVGRHSPTILTVADAGRKEYPAHDDHPRGALQRSVRGGAGGTRRSARHPGAGARLGRPGHRDGHRLRALRRPGRAGT